MRKTFLFLFLFCTIIFSSYSQVQKTPTSAEIYHKIEKLNFFGTVLYVAAHPDDENTALISYLSNQEKARVGYISLTRGDGGQNLIGAEIRELLGVIRTEELFEARKVDGGYQFFSRANDFGYSKHPDETFEIWNKEEVLNDLIYVIRKFKPDVIINRFDHRTSGNTHGHHTASAMLSVEAFDKVNDPTVFPEHLQNLEVWQPKRMFFNTNWWFFGSQERFNKIDKSKFFTVDVGNYYPMFGSSNTEISSLSRSKHRSQGFGTDGKRGSDVNFLEPIKGKFDLKKDTSLFAGINTTWERVEGGAKIGRILQEVQNNFDFKNPSASVTELLKAYELIKTLDDKHWREVKLQEIKEIILDCTGLYLQTTTSEEFITRGQVVPFDLEITNRSSIEVNVEKVSIFPDLTQLEFNEKLKYNEAIKEKGEFLIPSHFKYTSPYWLEKESSIGMYRVDDQSLLGSPVSPEQFYAEYYLNIGGIKLVYTSPIKHKTVSPSDGEIIKPVSIVPKVSVAMHNRNLIFADNQPKTVKVEVKAYENEVKGKLRLNSPEGWKVSPAYQEVDLSIKGQSISLAFEVTPPNEAKEGMLEPVFELGNEHFTHQLHIVDYPHIPTQTVILPASIKTTRFSIKTKGDKIAYIEGAGDDMPQSLREIGYIVDVIQARDITLNLLQQYDAVVVGIRAYDTDNGLVVTQPILFSYVKKGGTVVTQYNTINELRTDVLAPYDLKLSRKRVTDEHSPVRLIAKKHPVLNSPNVITPKDFEGWVQERGLYFPDEWSDEFTPILGMSDKGEKELKGALLVAEYGEGHFVYTSLSFFRELPAGVPGAYRLFANLLSLGN